MHPRKSEAKQKKSVCTQIAEKISELVSTSTSHGLPSAVRTQHTSIRVIWLASFLLCTSVCSYLTFTSMLDYFAHEVITQVRVVNEFESEFPRVLICNANEFTSEYALRFLTDSEHQFSNLNPTDLDSADFVVYHNKQALRYVSKAFTDSMKQRLAYSLNETLLSCRLGGIACDSSDFVWVYNDFHGNCHVFNSGRDSTGKKVAVKSIHEPGRSSGLQLELFVGMAPGLEKFSVNGFSGAKIYIGNNSFKSLYEDQLEILVSSGAQTNIG